MNSQQIDLKPGQVLATDGHKHWVLDIPSGKILWRSKEGDPAPDIVIRVDAVFFEMLQRMEADFDWTDPLTDRDLYDKILQTHAARTHLNFSLEQTPVLPHTAYKRVHLIPKNPPADVLLVGDDDLLSIPLALLGHRVTVLEIDPLTIKTIRHFQEKWNLSNIELQSHDLTQALAPELAARFDYCFTDPLSTYNCLLVFMSRAVSCLKPGGELFVAATDAGDAICQHLSSRMQLDQIKKYRGMNHYYTIMFAVCHYTSHYLRYRKSPTTKPLLTDGESFQGDLFSFANSFDYHFIEDYYGCAVLANHSTLEVIGMIHQAIDPTGNLLMPATELGKTAFMVWQHKSIRIRLDQQRRWIGVDALPLERREALELERTFQKLLKPERSVSRVAERNPGRP